MVCIFGSCRVYYGPRKNGPYRPFSFTHSTKVVLQLLKWKDKNERQLKKIYKNELFLLADDIKKLSDFLSIMKNVKDYVDRSKLIIIEICSVKEVFYKDVFLLDNRCSKSIIEKEYMLEFPIHQLIHEPISKKLSRNFS